jgi:hypothetical protein
MASSVIEGH